MSDILRVVLRDLGQAETTLAFTIRSAATSLEIVAFLNALADVTCAQVLSASRDIDLGAAPGPDAVSGTYGRVRYRVRSLWNGAVDLESEFNAPADGILDIDGALLMANPDVLAFHDALAVLLERTEPDTEPEPVNGSLLASGTGASEILRAADAVSNGLNAISWYTEHGLDVAVAEVSDGS